MDGHQHTSSHDLPLASEPPAGHATLVQRIFAWQTRDTVFYLISISLHVAVAFILAGSWKSSTTRTAQQTPPAPQAAPVAPAARLEIDVAPVRYTDMDIRRLLPTGSPGSNRPSDSDELGPPGTPASTSIPSAPSRPAAPEPLRRAPPNNSTPEATPSMELNPAASANPAGRTSGVADGTAPRLGFAFIDATEPAPSHAEDQLGIDLNGSSAAKDSSLPMSISERFGQQPTQTKDARHGARR